MKKINPVICAFAQIAPDLKDGSKKISNEKKNNLLMSIFENFSLKIKKNKYGTINDIKLNINLTRF